MRKLASLQTVLNIKTIPEADRICAYQINGWYVVDTIGKFEIGETVIYLEPDSFVPRELAPYLSGDKEPNTFEGVRGERLRTKRLKGVYSQGLLLKNTFPDKCVGDDVTEALGILKWEKPVPANISGLAKGNFPSTCPKTDEERVQNLVMFWDEYSSHDYEVTEKLEGTSTTFGLDDNEFVVCSRNLSLKDTTESTQWSIAKAHDLENKMRDLSLNNFFIQGELIGTGIQGDYYSLKKIEYYVFSVYDANTKRYLTSNERIPLVEKLGLKHVPVVEHNFSLKGKTVHELLDMADGKSLINPSKNREGLVLKQVDGQLHFKIVSNKYLLKNGD